MVNTRRQAPPELSGRNTIIAKSYILPSGILQYQAGPASPVRINTSSISRAPFGVRGMRGHITGGAIGGELARARRGVGPSPPVLLPTVLQENGEKEWGQALRLTGNWLGHPQRRTATRRGAGGKLGKACARNGSRPRAERASGLACLA